MAFTSSDLSITYCGDFAAIIRTRISVSYAAFTSETRERLADASPVASACHRSFQCRPLSVLTATSAWSASLFRENAALIAIDAVTLAESILKTISLAAPALSGCKPTGEKVTLDQARASLCHCVVVNDGLNVHTPLPRRRY